MGETVKRKEGPLSLPGGEVIKLGFKSLLLGLGQRFLLMSNHQLVVVDHEVPIVLRKIRKIKM